MTMTRSKTLHGGEMEMQNVMYAAIAFGEGGPPRRHRREGAREPWKP